MKGEQVAEGFSLKEVTACAPREGWINREALSNKTMSSLCKGFLLSTPESNAQRQVRATALHRHTLRIQGIRPHSGSISKHAAALSSNWEQPRRLPSHLAQSSMRSTPSSPL